MHGPELLPSIIWCIRDCPAALLSTLGFLPIIYFTSNLLHPLGAGSWVSKEDYKNIFWGGFCEKNLKYMWSIQWLSQFKEILGKTLSVWSVFRHLGHLYEATYVFIFIANYQIINSFLTIWATFFNRFGLPKDLNTHKSLRIHNLLLD